MYQVVYNNYYYHNQKDSQHVMLLPPFQTRKIELQNIFISKTLPIFHFFDG